MKKLKVLLYGATGSQSGTVPTHLLKAGHQPYVLTRNAANATRHAEAGAIVVEGDMSDFNRLVELSQGMDAVSLLIPFFADPTRVADYGRNVIDAAKIAGVKLLVWNTSGAILPQETGDLAMDVRLTVFNHLKESELPYIILQPGLYLENLLGPWTAPYVINENRVAYPVPADMPISWIASDDVSALVAAALQRPDLAGSNWQISGLENPTGETLAYSFTEGLGRQIEYYPLPPKKFGEILDGLYGVGAGAAAANMYQSIWDYPDKRPNFQADMQPVLAQLPVRMTSIREWVASHRREFTAPALV